MINCGDFAAGATVPIAFVTNAATGAAVAPSSAFEAADLKIYKNGSATERASAAGVTMTSPFDSIAGLHMVTIDTSDNTDAGFYAAGATFTVVLAPDETIDSQAVVAVLAQFSIRGRSLETVQDELETFIDDRTDAADTSIADLQTDVTAIKAKTTNLPSDPADQSLVEAAITSATSPLATASSLATVAGYVDTEVAAIKAKTDNLPSDPADASDIAALIGALPSASSIASAVWGAGTRTLTAISDSAGVTTLLTRIASALNISGGKVDADVKKINGTTLTGDGSSGNKWGPA